MRLPRVQSRTLKGPVPAKSVDQYGAWMKFALSSAYARSRRWCGIGSANEVVNMVSAWVNGRFQRTETGRAARAGPIDRVAQARRVAHDGDRDPLRSHPLLHGRLATRLRRAAAALRRAADNRKTNRQQDRNGANHSTASRATEAAIRV